MCLWLESTVVILRSVVLKPEYDLKRIIWSASAEYNVGGHNESEET